LARLLAGGFPGKTYGGSVRVGGGELAEARRGDLWRRVCLVTHEDYIFGGAVGENLLMAKRDATDAEMRDALRRAGILDFFADANGLDTKIAEGGANLSGGQRQRLSLARALLLDADIYIFDEATSNVDRESEEIILAAVGELAERKCALMISHRLANLAGAGRIYVMAAGRVVESGTREELMALGGVYARFFDEQRELEAYAAGGGKSAERETYAAGGGTSEESAECVASAESATSAEDDASVSAGEAAV
jgi:ABC-type multidrug transport system fused ATPase/permease subunit